MKLLDPITIKNITFKNRVVMPPMCMYQVTKEDGILTSFHYVHYMTRAYGQVGTIIQEATAVMPNGRITVNDLGLWNEEQVEPLKRLVQDLKKEGTIVGIQLSHAGRKSQVPDITYGPSSIAFGDLKKPKEMTLEDIQEVIKAFGKSAKRAYDIGYDILEIHAAHGYLINEFLSPLSNHRTDEYKAGSRFLVEVIQEIKKYFLEDRILQIRISATEYDEKGLTPEDLSKIINELKIYNIDIINVSTGGIVLKTIETYPEYQIKPAITIKEKTGLKVIAGGLVQTAELANKILEETSIDFIYMGRKLLREPYFLLNETELEWPKPYLRAKIQ
ncbi:flavin oxidoreductase/NADH oxidase [Alteracholeplasma palmae J233]|uniref:Flavin oxidoreductase/NADH oxidase n=1 Tax=Alteracholeplasma palmae (strain ATCC 49389 / J233) TaxID=1318466 RepID=U4KK19_ALTPJ|nr:flavin oxidoreductase/NADH oxidase [Alteracholeplasma palmae]CCV63949.1 flavin oxidoreductase/NADH oxidase [Alteracholeplasma palmae J233]